MTMLQTPAPSISRLDLLARESGVEYVNGHVLEKPVSIESSMIAAVVSRILGNVAKRTDSAWVFDSSMGYQCFADEPGRFRKPDVSVVRGERMVGIDPKSGFFRIPPDLAVEVLSPNDLAYDINEKVEDYLRNGVATVWIIDPNTRSVTVRNADGSASVLHEQDEITAGSIIPDFKFKVAEFFPAPAK
jgi:Uma2 family endonuclease